MESDGAFSNAALVIPYCIATNYGHRVLLGKWLTFKLTGAPKASEAPRWRVRVERNVRFLIDGQFRHHPISRANIQRRVFDDNAREWPHYKGDIHHQ